MTLYLQELVEGSKGKPTADDYTLNPATGLTSNYVNLYVEIVLLFDLLPAMPDCLDEIRQWTPLSYEEHVKASALKNMNTILNAYKETDPGIRQMLDDTVIEANAKIKQLQAQAEEAVQSGDNEAIWGVSQAACEEINTIIADVNRLLKTGTPHPFEQDQPA